jgi:spermidine synthase
VRLLTALSSEHPAFEIGAVLALVGFTAVIGQIVLMREFIVVFNGNEISLGMVLATWLVWTAAGSRLASRLGHNRAHARWKVALLECLVGVSLPPTIWAVRASKSFFQRVPGELVGPVPMLLTSLICLSLFCFFCGHLFVVAARLYGQERSVASSVASSSAYLFEAGGSALGGLLASLVLLRFLDSFQIAAIVALLNLMAGVLLSGIGRQKVSAIALIGVCAAVPLFLYVVPVFVRSSQSYLWRGFHLLESRDSIYGNLSVVETGNVRSIYDNGLILANVPDDAAAEEAVHYALLEHPAPKRILLIGGGTNGSIAQILKHPTIERVDYVELDPLLIDMAKQFFPAQSAPLVADSRVRTHYADGRLYLRTVHDKFDVIILNLPDPQTAQLNRFYTAEFFRSARDHLRAGGLLALQLRASEDYISPELAEFLRCIHYTLREVFPNVVTIPGETTHFFAAEQSDVLTVNPQTLISRLQARSIQAQYVREYFIPYRMMPDRMAQIQHLLQPTPTISINRDFEPIAYYFDVLLWSGQFKGGYHSWFEAAARFQFTRVIDWLLVVLLGVAGLFAYAPAHERRPRAAAVYCMAATGFTLMALQIFLLLAFQSVYGYVYHQLAILIGMFMAGIALGCWLAIERVRVRDYGSWMTVAAVTQFLLALSAPLLLFFVTLLSRGSNAPRTLLVAQFAFPALAVLCGMLGGLQFPIATEIYLRESGAQTGLGVLYAVDLVGGCAGALLLSTYLIPVFGFWKTAWLSGAVNLAPALLATRVSLESRKSLA